MMRPSSPRYVTWLLSLVLGVLGLLGHIAAIPVISGWSFWLVLAGLGLLLLATIVKGL
jgi:hypothetical protein